jgi:hypothetical protein
MNDKMEQLIMSEIMDQVKVVPPPRPKVNKEIIKVATEKIITQLPESPSEGFNEFSVNDIVESIVESYHYGMNGYELAKRLDDHCGWYDIDVDMVNTLDGMDHEVRNILEKKEKEWEKEYNIHPTLEMNTKIKEGVIIGIDEYYAARYRVKPYDCVNNRYLLIKFEDAIPI